MFLKMIINVLSIFELEQIILEKIPPCKSLLCDNSTHSLAEYSVSMITAHDINGF